MMLRMDKPNLNPTGLCCVRAPLESPFELITPEQYARVEEALRRKLETVMDDREAFFQYEDAPRALDALFAWRKAGQLHAQEVFDQEDARRYRALMAEEVARVRGDLRRNAWR